MAYAQTPFRGRVGVLFGGDSAEREISLVSGRFVLQALTDRGYDVVGIDVRFIPDLYRSLAALDCAFIALHGRGGEDGVIQAMLDSLGIPYTGSGVMASAIAMDKLRSKWLWAGAGLPTPAFRHVRQGDAVEPLLAELGGVVMVKPPLEGSSIGMSRVTSEQELVAAVDLARQYGDEVLLEQWIQGQEFTCAILDDSALPVIRLKTPHAFYDFSAKYQDNTTEYLVPCGLSEAQEQSLQQLSVDAFNALGARGWGRVDVMMDEQGKFWLLELNSVPGMTDHSLVPMAAKAAGLAFADLVERILMAAVDRRGVYE